MVDLELRTSFEARRGALVGTLIRTGALRTPRVIEAFRRVPRHAFVPARLVDRAYDDEPLSIGFEQTISQPTIVAIMTEALELSGSERVLEIGTGSGYQAAILSLLAREVFSVERIEPLADRARGTLSQLRFRVHVRTGDGHLGLPQEAPFDRILLTAAPEEIPRALVEQLAPGGRIIAPVGVAPLSQELVAVRKSGDDVIIERLVPVRFVPMIHGVEASS